MLNHCNIDGTITIRDSTHGSFMTKPATALHCKDNNHKICGNSALPNSMMIKILPEMESLSDTIINRRAGLPDQDGTHCSIVPLWYVSSGSTE